MKHKPVEKHHWRVDYGKAGGFCARRIWNGPTEVSDIFPTQEEVYAWLRKQGLTPNDEDPNIWH